MERVEAKHRKWRSFGKLDGRKMRAKSDNEAWGIEFRIGFTEGGDHAIPASFRGAKGDNQDLVLVGGDGLEEFPLEKVKFGGVEVAFKNRKLQVIAKVFAGFKDAGAAFVVGDIVADKVGGTHGGGGCEGRLAGEERNIFGYFSSENPGEDAELEFDCSAVTDFVVENGVRDQGVDALLVTLEEFFPARGAEIHGPTSGDEVVGGDESVIDGGDHGGLGDQGAKLFHDVEGKGGATVARLMIKSDIGIETDGGGGEGAIFGEETVSEGEKGVDGVGGWTPVSASKVEGKDDIGGAGGGRGGDAFEEVVVVVGVADETWELAKVGGGGGAFDAEELFERGGLEGVFAGLGEAKFGGFWGLDVVAHEEDAVIMNFASDELLGEAEAGDGIGGLPKLSNPGEDIFKGMPSGDAVEPSTQGKIGQGNFLIAEALDGLGGDLNLTKKGDVADIEDADFINETILLLHFNDGVVAPHAVALGVEVKGAFFVARGDQAPRGAICGCRCLGGIRGVEIGLKVGWRSVGEELGFVR